MADQLVSSALPLDNRTGQIKRTVASMLAHPEGVSVVQLKAETDAGSVTKVLSEMRRIGFGIRKQLRHETCLGGTKQRRTWRFFLASHPSKLQQDLFDPQ